jgi:hypothetical protein
MRGSFDPAFYSIASVDDAVGACADTAVVVLVEEADAAEQLSTRLRTVCGARGRRESVLVASPPHRGVKFFSDPDVQATVDEWWGRTIPRHLRPLYVTEHHADLPEWVGGVDGHFYVAVPDPDAAQVYRGRENVSPIVGTALTDAFLDRLLPACGISPRKRRESSRERHATSTSRRFRRARIAAAEEVSTATGIATRIKMHQGSEAFFQPTEDPETSDADINAAQSPQVTEELIGVLTDTISKLKSLRPKG